MARRQSGPSAAARGGRVPLPACADNRDGTSNSTAAGITLRYCREIAKSYRDGDAGVRWVRPYCDLPLAGGRKSALDPDRDGKPYTATCARGSGGRVVMHRTANPRMPVRFRPGPPILPVSTSGLRHRCRRWQPLGASGSFDLRSGRVGRRPICGAPSGLCIPSLVPETYARRVGGRRRAKSDSHTGRRKRRLVLYQAPLRLTYHTDCQRKLVTGPLPPRAAANGRDCRRAMTEMESRDQRRLVLVATPPPTRRACWSPGLSTGILASI
jgi:hypothetical protein